ncbi:MAG: hypothetical protein H8D87_20405 [Deltaproteobacteria bacterium]|uniref:radical SAM protein n=1 Tax=Desulfobacula sp. TaxID=2593537 RepID=UPI0019C27384|nr:hypothetical protein [Candidatus Desulfobacula maris]MBL6992319.1 hypothetical protein [Desulfobacula sp.]
MEQKKNKFLAALYEKNFQAAEQIYIDIVKHAEIKSEFSENTLKLLSQIQAIFKRFKPVLLKHCPGINEYNNHLKNLISNTTKQSCADILHIDFLSWETKLGLDSCQKDLLYKTAMNFQLTSGCSNYCRRCNEWALPGVRSHFSHKAVLKILKHMADQGNDEISLYGASDPLDWEQNGKSIEDIIAYCKTLPFEYSLLTKVPKGKEELLKKILKNDANLSVSITAKNKARIKKIERDFGNPISFQHDLDELLIPAGLDEDFATIKPSITDGYGTEITPDGAFIIIPTFTSALYPFGHKKIRITSETNFFPIKKTGRDALPVDYFKPLKGYDLNKTQRFLTRLLDVQIESIILDNGTEELTPPGMRSLKEYLSIFEEKARLQREKITSSVMRRLKKQFLSNISFKNLSQKTRILYIKKISRHLNLCKKENCLSSKLSAASFFLESIFIYAQKNEAKIKIMRFLLKDEIALAFNIYRKPVKLIADRPLEELLIDPDIDSFGIFRFYVFCLLNKSNDSTILEFIKTYPSFYDPVADIFVQS